ncbi:carboxymuconolactone decarboxylase family protein [Crenobacter cavernae]|uniref:Carboxymuconolactone decarboxylase family protein n=1 Tax=Crenobacter cavernae TaxID=2290923 RepID=A0A345Y7N0_9NEIS|nr:carboxymuconolactone decarboxylase family protein [Crenobacter cavernae]AXK39932.1 carboxymuconolactone decarboxylase family protein [Crenobacter cavernae]
MSHFIDYPTVAPKGYQAQVGLELYVRNSGLETSLRELVKTRVSQLNGCALCIDMHTKDARAEGETEQRLYLLSAWREAPCYTPRERAALAWAEALTLLAQHAVPESLHRELAEHFSDKEKVELTWCIVAINGWNLISIACGTPAGNYQPGQYDR